MEKKAIKSEDRKKKDYRGLIVIVILIVVALSSTGISVWAVFFRDKANSKPPANNVEILEPDKAPDKDDNAQLIEDDSTDEKIQRKKNPSVTLKYSNIVKIDLTDEKVALIFGNPVKSNQSMVLQIIIKDNIIAQSNLIKPGYEINKLKLKNASLLKAGVYSGKFKILYYDLKTEEKSVVNTEIPIKVNIEQ